MQNLRWHFYSSEDIQNVVENIYSFLSTVDPVIEENSGSTPGHPQF